MTLFGRRKSEVGCYNCPVLNWSYLMYGIFKSYGEGLMRKREEKKNFKIIKLYGNFQRLN